MCEQREVWVYSDDLYVGDITETFGRPMRVIHGEAAEAIILTCSTSPRLTMPNMMVATLLEPRCAATTLQLDVVQKDARDYVTLEFTTTRGQRHHHRLRRAGLFSDQPSTTLLPVCCIIYEDLRVSMNSSM